MNDGVALADNMDVTENSILLIVKPRRIWHLFWGGLLNHQIMFVNYTRIAFRHHKQHKLYALINACGLAVGITVMLLAILYLKDENSFDRFHERSPYRITTTLTAPGGNPQLSGNTGQLQGPVFRSQVPEITAYTRVMGGDIYGDIIGNDKVMRQQLLYADEHFFDVFTFPLLKGDARTVLQDIGSVVITESTARKYFNHTDVVGQLLRMDADPSARILGKPLVVAGVVKDPPLYSSLQFDIVLPFRLLQLSFNDTNWFNVYLSTFVLLRADADAGAVAQKMNRIQSSTYASGGAPAMLFGLQPVTDIHLHPLYTAEGSREGGIINGSNPACPGAHRSHPSAL